MTETVWLYPCAVFQDGTSFRLDDNAPIRESDITDNAARLTDGLQRMSQYAYQNRRRLNPVSLAFVADQLPLFDDEAAGIIPKGMTKSL